MINNNCRLTSYKISIQVSNPQSTFSVLSVCNHTLTATTTVITAFVKTINRQKYGKVQLPNVILQCTDKKVQSSLSKVRNVCLHNWFQPCASSLSMAKHTKKVRTQDSNSGFQELRTGQRILWNGMESFLGHLRNRLTI